MWRGIFGNPFDSRGGPINGSIGGSINGSIGGSISASREDLIDRYASLLYVDALNRHRGASIDLNEPDAIVTLSDPRGEGKDDHSHVRRWSPWVRSCLVAQELIGRMQFVVSPPAGEHIDIQLSVRRSKDDPTYENLVRMINPSQAVFKAQTTKVLQWAELREERAPEILAQLENQHVMWGALVPIQTDRMAATRELLEAAIQMSIYVQMRFKHEFACWRPIDYSPQVQPMLTTPGHGSLPGGHSTQVYVVYEVLKSLLNTRRKESAGDELAYQSMNRQLSRIAERVSTNRVIAGVHFPVDNVAGRLLGIALGEFFVHCGGYRVGEGTFDQKKKKKHPVMPWVSRFFDGRQFAGHLDFDPMTQDPFGQNPPNFYPKVPEKPQLKNEPECTVLAELWEAAEKECEALAVRFS